jgi:hypothetical protein
MMETVTLIPEFEMGGSMIPIGIVVDMEYTTINRVHTSEEYPFDQDKTWSRVIEITPQAARGMLINDDRFSVHHNWFLNKGVCPYAMDDEFIYAIYHHDYRWYIIKQPIEDRLGYISQQIS